MKWVCVFCGAREGASAAYAEAARAFGALVAARGLGLVTGGGALGLMGVVTDAALAGGASVVGVIPASLVDREVAHVRLTERVVVRDMFERKGEMMRRADAFLALPGGMGTLDEITEVLTWTQLGLFAKPCGLVNVSGYWDPLLAMLDRAVAQGFLSHEHRALTQVDSDAARLLDRFAAWQQPSAFAGSRT
ncbi:MAG: TIGR00730 family Rossman fold protein [Deltaproteobacteria bacterium]|nr:TIGR00730 family Rossman fold protein [Deltaproteobacteria bacterium]